MPASIKGAVEEDAVEGAAEDAIEEGAAEGVAELIGRYPVIMPRFKVCINDATRFGVVLIAKALLVALQIKVNGPPAKTISTLELRLG